jgi:hypothetical protein
MTSGDGSKDVTVQDSTSPIIQYFFMQEQKTDITLTSDVAIGDEIINVSAGHGFTAVAGEHIVLFENNRFLQLKVKSVAVDAITVDQPVTAVFTVASAAVIRGNISMNVDGSGGDIDFLVKLRNFTIPLDVGAVIITMQHGANVPDDGKFGGIAALADGVFFQKEDGSIFSLGNYTTNQDFKDVGGRVEYTDKAPAGTNATDITFNIKEVFGQVIRVDPGIDDCLRGTVRDDISLGGTGMAKFTASVVGSYTVGEQ